MSRIRIVQGTITKTTAGDHNIYSEGNIVYNSGTTVTQTSDVQITYGDPKNPPPVRLLKRYFEEGWWSSDQEGNIRIKEALIGDHVYFHIKTKDIPDGEVVQMKLYDDDNTEKNEPKEKGKDNDDFIKTRMSGKTDNVTRLAVKSNKVVVSIILDNLESFINDESDKQVELYYRCSYKNEHVEFPRIPSDYLKVKEKAPLIIFVNGYWNNSYLQKDLLGFSDGKYLKGYWGEQILKNTVKYFLMKDDKNILFLNGADGMLSSGSDRFKNGSVFANERLANQKSNFYQEVFKSKRKIMIVSHSMGAAFAEGLISVLKTNQVKVEKVVHLSPADTSDFSVTLPNCTYQIDIDWDPVLMLKNLNDKYFINGVLYYGLVQNPGHDHFGHANTKLEGYVWDWFEDLELIKFNYEETQSETVSIPGNGMGYGGSSYELIYEKYSALNLKHNTIFIKIIKNTKTYIYRKNKHSYFVEK